MKTLIIHPEDDSTYFLDIVYTPIENKTVITKHKTKQELINLINEHDRIMMMGHGSPSGLFSVGKFPTDNGYIIDSSFVPYLKNKTDNLFIWCNADKFIEKYDLKGFYTGMFISEVGEAYYCGLPDTYQNEVDLSNFGFCNILAKYINNDSFNIHENVTKEYGRIAIISEVATYNNERLYVK